ncbi:alginate O-acetyltransferase AlgF [Nevskia sp.]|uniref:alginate O-acetyltransferase AlgF n=1 Tax=Nevskia sp. TaxID=1929292 RepID=UPI003F70F101
MVRLKTWFGALIFLMTAVLPMQSQAQLYAKGAPPGSAFVRVLNGTAAQSPSGFIGETAQPALPAFTAGQFIFLPPGDYPVQLGSRKETFKLEADRFYSIAYLPDSMRSFQLEGFKSQLKAMVIMMNLLPDRTLSLKTADGKVTVLDAIAPFKAGQREINPLSVSLGLFDGDKKIIDVPAATFERGKASSLIVGGTSTVPILAWDEQK